MRPVIVRLRFDDGGFGEGSQTSEVRSSYPGRDALQECRVVRQRRSLSPAQVDQLCASSHAYALSTSQALPAQSVFQAHPAEHRLPVVSPCLPAHVLA